MTAGASILRSPLPRETAQDQLDVLIDRCKRDPQYFFDEVLNLKRCKGDRTDEWVRDAWQSELGEVVADVWRKQNDWPTKVNHKGKNFITMRSMHGPGKTFGMASIAHYFNFCWPGRIFATAPKLKQVKDLLFSEFRKIRARAEPWYKALVDVQALSARWCGDTDWCMLADSATNPENMAGKHASHVLVLVDEASGVPETLWPVIFAALSTGHIVILLMISNPTQTTGTFADSHLKPELEQDYHRVHVSVEKVTNPLRSVQMRTWREKMERRYGLNSPVVKVRCYGEFAGSGPNQLMAQEWLEASRNREAVPDGSIPRIRIAVDVSDGGECETVVTGAKRYDSFVHVNKQRRFSHPSSVAPIKAADEAERLFFDLGGKKGQDEIVVDSIGVGAGTAGTLILRGHRVIAYKGGAESTNPKRWRNQRCQSHFNARDAFRDGLLILDDEMYSEDPDPMTCWTELYAQCCSIRTRDSNDRVDDLVPKADMIGDGIVSPDMAESLFMLYATMSASIQPGSAIPAPRGGQTVVERSTITDGVF